MIIPVLPPAPRHIAGVSPHERPVPSAVPRRVRRRVGVGRAARPGAAGARAEALKWLDWYSNEKRGPQPKIPNSECLILTADGLVYIDCGGESNPIERGYMGIGTGGPIAVGAHMAGADAETAVHIACQIDANSGGDVIVHRLKP